MRGPAVAAACMASAAAAQILRAGKPKPYLCQLSWLLDNFGPIQQPDAPDTQHAAVSKGLQRTGDKAGAEQMLMSVLLASSRVVGGRRVFLLPQVFKDNPHPLRARAGEQRGLHSASCSHDMLRTRPGPLGEQAEERGQQGASAPSSGEKLNGRACMPYSR